MFVNTLALRNYPEDKKTFKEFIQDLRWRTLEAFKNQDYQFDQLIENLGIARDAGRNPLFDVMFELQNFEESSNENPAPASIMKESEKRRTKFDLTLVGSEAREEIFIKIIYNSILFKKETIEKFIMHFKNIVSSVLANPDKKLSEIELISEMEKEEKLSRLFDDLESE
jgi:non-ribosomal peptide synthetase component F